MKRISLSLFVVFLLSVMLGNAQQLTIKSLTIQPTDKTAKEKAVIDSNGDTCALVKIKTDNLKGLQFPNHTQYVGDIIYKDGMYYMYKSPHLSRMISFQHPDYAPGLIDPDEYGFKRMKGGKTYLVVLEAPASGVGKGFVVLKVYPQNATVTFDNKKTPASTSGVFEYPVSDGTYIFTVEAPNYESAQGSVSIANGEKKTQTVRLNPITHDVNVVCNLSNAHVFVDNIDYGKVGKQRLPQGIHQVRVQYEGYLDVEKTVEISSSTLQIPFQLKKNENIVDIHATPVTISSKSPKIYKNNKELKGWISGKPVMFMPGKYMISDVDGNEKVITVGTKPMEVNL